MTNSAPAMTGAMPSSGRYSETALSGIYEISKIVTSPSSLKVMLNNVVSVMSSFLDMRLATLVLIDQEGDPEIKVSASTEPALAAGDSAEIPMAVIDQIVATATPLAVQNCALHPLFAGWKRLGSIAPGFIQTFIGVPIRVDSEVAGTLAIERVWKGTMDVRIDHDVRFLTMVANLVGQALKLHRVVAEDRERLIFEQHRLAKELSTLKAAKSPPPKLSGILGKSRAIRAVTERIEQVAKSNAPVLIRGETGTGKELIARALYQHSDRVKAPFIAINCAAIPETLLESELFGHERGAFTGAENRRIGRFEQADRGTIFLDEIGDMTPGTQIKLMRVLQERSLQRLGGKETLPVDVRVLAATNRDLESAIQHKLFREDLYYRLSVVVIHLPPLRQRKEDIPELAKYFLRKYAAELGVADPSIHDEAVAFLQAQNWPGNVREMENTIRKVLLYAQGYTINIDHVHTALSRTSLSAEAVHLSLREQADELLAAAQRGELSDAHGRLLTAAEREIFSRAIELAHGNQAKAARWLGVSRITMKSKLVQFGLHPGRDLAD